MTSPELRDRLERHARERHRALQTAQDKLRAIGRLIEQNGCDCGCDHHYEDHDEDCELCLACRIGKVVGR